MNEEDAEQIALFLEGDGLQPAAGPSTADVVLLNTCSVRRKPEEKVFSKLGELRELKAARPELIIGVCGCMAQVQWRAIARRAPHVDFIVGTGHASEIPRMVRRAAERRELAAGRHGPLLELGLPERKGAVVSDVPLRALGRPARIRAFVPIMYGCDRFCTFCIVPETRGRERSRPIEDVVSEVRRLAISGTCEVTLLGQTVNSYGRNLPEPGVTFARLLRLVAGVEGIRRIRFTSPHPCGFTDDLVRAIAEIPEVCEHVHLPLQVADDELLRRMKRGYTSSDFARVLDALRESVPGIAVTTDIMLGFPGETESQFQATMRFVRSARFDAAFMFAYSPRPGTRAAQLPDQVPDDVKVARLSELIETQNRITAEINAALVGRSLEVLVDGTSARNRARVTGLSRTFKTVHIERSQDATAEPGPGDFVQARIVEGGLTGLIATLGEPADAPSSCARDVADGPRAGAVVAPGR